MSTTSTITTTTITHFKQGEFWDKKDYIECYINYDNLIGCISKEEPLINVIHVKYVESQCVVTTRYGPINVARPTMTTTLRAKDPSTTATLGV